jgi:hypothetical protein
MTRVERIAEFRRRQPLEELKRKALKASRRGIHGEVEIEWTDYIEEWAIRGVIKNAQDALQRYKNRPEVNQTK